MTSERPLPTGEVLLLVCRANLIRSPLAAGMLRGRLATQGRHDLLVASGGMAVGIGDRPGAEVVELGRERGVDVTSHRAQPATVDALSRAALVVTMTEEQRSSVARMARVAVPRTFTLVELIRLLTASEGVPVGTWTEMAQRAHRARPYVAAPPGLEDVPDPVGRTAQQHRDVADSLVTLVEQLASRVAPRATLSSG